ncbi:MoaB/Mog domain-containing protein [Pelagophyceae sp. CCMP2097]|nr:MoaB/Mog domain-containing protein [Pelagophyceae sp. CCMP2097]
MASTVEAEAYAFRALVAHLRSVSDEAPNIDVMNASGMCRNCLCKWYEAGARATGGAASLAAAQLAVYGEPYADWKKAHAKPATPEQLALFEATKPWHAKHVKAPATGEPATAAEPAPAAAEPPAAAVGSAVAARPEPCCYEDDAAPLGEPGPPPPPSARIRLGVLTVSDRAAAGTYEDASGPAVVEAARLAFGAGLQVVCTAIVADDADAIGRVLCSWADDGACDLVLTTGGTGFGPRDVTPEATRAVLHKLAPGLIDAAHAARKSGGEQALLDSLLSRAVAGVRKACVVVNLPGRPQAAAANTRALAPTLRRALALVQPAA